MANIRVPLKSSFTIRDHLGANHIKPFTAVIYGFSYKARVFPGKPFRPSLMFVGLPGTNSSLLRKSVNYDLKKFYRIGPWKWVE